MTQTPAERRIIEDMSRMGRNGQMDDKLLEQIKADRKAMKPLSVRDQLKLWLYDENTFPFPECGELTEFVDYHDELLTRILAAADRIEALEAERDRLRYVLGGVAAAIDTGRNEPLVVWREQIEIALIPDTDKGSE